MKRGIVVCLVAVAAPAVALSAAAGRDPRLETLRLAPADMRLARSAVVRRSDLGAGWTRVAVTASAQEAPDCPGYRPDFSRFTVTGQADAQFAAGSGARSVISRVEVYASRAQARGDFALSTRPPVAACLGIMLRRESVRAGVTFQLTSSRRVTRPRLGERSAAYRIVGTLSSGGTRVRVHVDAVVVLRGRSIGSVFFTGAVRPVPGQQQTAGRLARRLR